MLNEPGPSEVLLRRDPTHRYQSRNHVRSWRERAENDRSCHCIWQQRAWAVSVAWNLRLPYLYSSAAPGESGKD